MDIGRSPESVIPDEVCPRVNGEVSKNVYYSASFSLFWGYTKIQTSPELYLRAHPHRMLRAYMPASSPFIMTRSRLDIMPTLDTRWRQLHLLRNTNTALFINTSVPFLLLHFLVSLRRALELCLLRLAGAVVVDGDLLAELGVDIFLLSLSTCVECWILEGSSPVIVPSSQGT